MFSTLYKTPDSYPVLTLDTNPDDPAALPAWPACRFDCWPLSPSFTEKEQRLAIGICPGHPPLTPKRAQLGDPKGCWRECSLHSNCKKKRCWEITSIASTHFMLNSTTSPLHLNPFLETLHAGITKFHPTFSCLILGQEPVLWADKEWQPCLILSLQIVCRSEGQKSGWPCFILLFTLQDTTENIRTRWCACLDNTNLQCCGSFLDISNTLIYLFFKFSSYTTPHFQQSNKLTLQILGKMNMIILLLSNASHKLYCSKCQLSI